jgi:tetratricopeptide (TPR) repeat protein/predicted Ser/Thr protein kinase
VLHDDRISKADLVELVCNDQSERWRARQRVPCESYLALHPALQDDKLAFEVVYHEYALRESLGETPEPQEFFWRFPRFADRLSRQLQLHDALRSGEAPEVGQPANPSDVTKRASRGIAGGLDFPGFEILEELGRGGAGVVYKARQDGLNRLVALKVIRAGFCDDADAADRFRAEAEAAARFQHPNLIQVYEVGEHEGNAYLALEYASGGSLHQKLAGTPQDPHDSARLVEALARALHYAHQRGIVHRDLKPANVVLTEEGVPKVTDFGLAKLLEHENGPTRTGDILGTPSYMSPEQAQGSSTEITPATDVYALGAILYEMLGGRPPFKGPTPLATLDQVVSQEPLPPGKFQRGIPRDLETICLKCLEKDPRRRYPSAADLAEDLHRFLNGWTIMARPSSAFEKAWKWGRRKPSTATALLTVAMALVVLLLGALYTSARLRESNFDLLLAARAAKAAERSSASNARAALDQRNLALKALNQLVFGVQDRLGESPETRPLRRSLLGTATAGLDEIARSTEAGAPDLSRAVAHQKLGEIFRQIGRAAEARRQLMLAQSLAEDLASATPGDTAVADCLAKTYLGLGELILGSERFDEARACFEKAVARAEAVVLEHPDREEARRGLMEAYFQLGRAYGFNHEIAAAEVWFRKTRDLAARCVAEQPEHARFKDMLASSYRKLGDMKKFTSHPAGARDEYLKAIALGRELLAAEPGNLAVRTHLAMAIHDLAQVTYLRREPNEARPLFQEAERHFSDLVAADPEDQLIQTQLVHVETDLARLERDEGQFGTALTLFRQALRRSLLLESEGRIEGRPGFNAQRIPILRKEIADCEAASAARAPKN